MNWSMSADDMKTRPLDPYACDLQGDVIVEAGAGTGKTYTIQILFLRLVLQGVDVRKILVVTFTEFATAELVERLHSVLLEMRLAIQRNRTESAQIVPLLKAYQAADDASQKAQREALRLALQHLDGAMVSTIHGFCRSMLMENAFESGMRYDAELMADFSEYSRHIAEDYCRRHCHGGVPQRKKDTFQPFWEAYPCTPETLLENTAAARKCYGSRVVWPEQVEEWTRDTLEEDWKDILALLSKKSFWRNFSLQDGTCLLECRQPAEGRLNFEQWWQVWTGCSWRRRLEWLEQMIGNVDLWREIRAKASDGESHRGVVDCEERLKEVKSLLDRMKIWQWKDFLEFHQKELERCKREDGILSFDDLILELKTKLCPEVDTPENIQVARRLRKAIRDRFSYVFVDEFQDTDQNQFRIFDEVFRTREGEEGEAAHRAFFMIGDPKQSIYAFRGGDVFAYLAASGRPGVKKYTLTTNYRSCPRYLHRLNAFYDAQEIPFGMRCVPFEEIRIPETAEESWGLYEGDRPVENLLTTGLLPQAAPQVSSHVVDCVAELLSGRYTLHTRNGTAAVKAEDIAILVVDKKYGEDMEAALRARGISAVWCADKSVYETPEASALLSLLKTLAETVSASAVGEILAGPLFRLETRVLRQWRQSDDAEVLAFFQQLATCWREGAFLQMFWKLLRSPLPECLRRMFPEGFRNCCTLAQYQMAQRGGKEALAHYLQLAELLHVAEQRSFCNPDALVMHLQGVLEGRIPAGDGVSKAANVRQGGEGSSVRLMTIHKSKGLEFPIVFLPKLLRKTSKAPLVFHRTLYGEELDYREYDPACAVERCVDYAEGKWGIVAGQEGELELFRLLYVGITRAKYACFLPYSSQRVAKGSLVGLLSNASPEAVKLLEGCLPGEGGLPREDNAVPADAAVVEAVSSDDTLTALSFHRHEGAGSGWDTCGFTRISQDSWVLGGGEDIGKQQDFVPQDQTMGGALDDDDRTWEGAGEPEGREPGEGEIQAPLYEMRGGADVGTAWHDFLQHLDFQQSDDALARCLEESYALQSLMGKKEEERRLRQMACLRMLKGIAHNPVGNFGFSLGQIPRTQTLREMRFLFQLPGGGIRLARVASALRSAGLAVSAEWLRRGETENYGGCVMNGSLDLLVKAPDGKFYILDWKTNRLGDEAADYEEPGMKAEADRRGYTFQLLLYTVALWHFLRERMGLELTEQNYDRHFGGVCDVFLRGVCWMEEAGRPESENAKTVSRGFLPYCPPYSLIQVLAAEIPVRDRCAEENA